MSCGCRGACGRCGRAVRRSAGIAPRRGRGPVMVPLSGPAGVVGRWGPVVTYGGRTEGEPCHGIGDVCTDLDVAAWHYSAKVWQQKARWVREMLVIVAGEKSAGTWPASAITADAALNAAVTKLVGDLGWTDGAKVETLVKIQRVFMWVAEAFAVAFDPLAAELGKGPIDGTYYQEQADDPLNTPPVIPWPGLPSFSDLFGIPLVPLAVGAGIVLLLAMRGGR